MQLKLLTKGILSVFWGIVVLVLYFQAHESFFYAILGGRHIGFVLISLGIFFVLVKAIIDQKKWSSLFSSVLGILIYIFIILLLVQIFLVRAFEIPRPINWSKILLLDLSHFVGLALLVSGTILNGNLCIPLLKIDSESNIYKPTIFGLGILVISAINFGLGYFNLLRIPFTWISLAWPIFLAPRKSWKILKGFWWNRIKGIDEVKWTGWLAIWVIGLFTALNLLEGIRPVPKGYDALSQYYNLIQIIGNTDQLVNGFGAYNWLLFVGLGKFVFEWDSLSFVWSNSMVFMSSIALYFLAKNRISKNSALILAAFFIATPLINVVPGLQQKVEGGILFFSIIGIHTLWVVLEDRPSIEKYSLWLGVICGYLFGIKYSTLILIWSFIVVIAWYFGNFWTLLASVGFIMAGVIFLNLDAFSNINLEHLNRDRSIYWLIGISSASLVAAIFDPLIQWKKMIVSLILLVGGSLLTFAPWMIKHYLETSSYEVSDLLNGQRQELLFDFEALKTQIQNEKNNN